MLPKSFLELRESDKPTVEQQIAQIPMVVSQFVISRVNVRGLVPSDELALDEIPGKQIHRALPRAEIHNICPDLAGDRQECLPGSVYVVDKERTLQQPER